MYVTVRLVVTAKGESPDQRFARSSGAGKTTDDQTKVWEFLKLRICADGLVYGLSPSGTITMRIPRDKFSKELGKRIEAAADDALKQI